MTQHEKQLAGLVLGQISDVTPEQAVERLFALGLVNIRVCEQRSLRAEVRRLEIEGIPRCEALHVAAEQFSCSYGKALNLFYNQLKS